MTESAGSRHDYGRWVILYSTAAHSRYSQAVGEATPNALFRYPYTQVRKGLPGTSKYRLILLLIAILKTFDIIRSSSNHISRNDKNARIKAEGVGNAAATARVETVKHVIQQYLHCTTLHYGRLHLYIIQP